MTTVEKSAKKRSKSSIKRLALLGTGVAVAASGFAASGMATANAAPITTKAHCYVTVLHYGMVNHYVGIVQHRLGIKRDNSFGPATLRAVKHYQRRHHLVVDGYVGPKTWASLGGFPGCGGGDGGGGHHKAKYPTLSYGDTGSAVRTAQKLLNSHLGGHNIATDGSFGPATLAQVKRFQRAYPHTAVDGVINKNDWKQLRGPVRHKKPDPPKKHKDTYAGWVASTDHSVNVRSGPGMKYRVVSHIGKGQYVKGTDYSKHWIKLSSGHYLNKGTLESKSSNLRSINGRMGTSGLCGIPHKYNTPDSFAPGYTKNRTRYINCHALAYLNSLENAYHRRYGKYALIDLAYRTYKEQVYWYNKLGYPRAAYPGTSNHGLGEAVDFTERHQGHFEWGGYGNKWLLAHAGHYGFANPFKPYTNGEAYHFNFVG